MTRPAGKEPALRPEEPEINREGPAVGLRLAIGKDGLGIELARSTPLGCLDVVELVIRLPRVRFPFDVSGGVTKFRHRRGELERLAIELDARRAARWAEVRLRGLIGTGPCTVTIAPRAFGATVSLITTDDLAALAFEVSIVPTPMAIVVHGARGVGLKAPATRLALRAVDALVSGVATREGARFTIANAAERICRALLPDVGVRAPSAKDVALAGLGESDGVVFTYWTRSPAIAADGDASTLANEAAFLTRAGDDARFSGDLDHARRLDLAALERAPRHPQVAQRIAEVDAHHGGRAEAAVATLRSADRIGCIGSLLGDLLEEMGDRPGAIAALLREGERDPSSAVAALAYARAADLALDPADALLWLDRAIARAPLLPELRWERATRRLAHGRISDARADFQELETLAEGARERYVVLRRAADIHRTRGLGMEAAMLYERALLYRPDDPETVAGLGVALAAQGRAPRGATLLARAIELAEGRVPAEPTAWMELELGRILGDLLGDRPAAIARLRAIADEAPEALEARGLEGRYRAAIGDIAGASLAFARLRERSYSSASATGGAGEATAVPWLEEAARFEDGRDELVAAQAHLAAALAIAPQRAEIEAQYRAVSARVATAAGGGAFVPPPAAAAPFSAAPHAAGPRMPPGPYEVRIEAKPDENARERATLAAPKEPVDDTRERATLAAPRDEAPPPEAVPPSEANEPSPEEDEMRVEALTRTLQGDPTNDTVVDELVVRLTRLGRSMDLLALLSARLEDAPPERREELLPRHRAVLETLETEARAAGRDGEADLFRMARDAS